MRYCKKETNLNSNLKNTNGGYIGTRPVSPRREGPLDYNTRQEYYQLVTAANRKLLYSLQQQLQHGAEDAAYDTIRSISPSTLRERKPCQNNAGCHEATTVVVIVLDLIV